MYVSKVISYLGGWEHLLLEKSGVYEEILYSLKNITEENLTNPLISRPHMPRNEKNEKLEITPFRFSHTMDHFLKEKGWEDYRVKPAEKGGIVLYAKNLKDRVSVRMLSSDRASPFTSWLLVETPKLHEAQVTDLSVLLVPEDDINEIFESVRHSFSLFSMTRCQAQLNDLSPLKNAAPFVIIGFSPLSRNSRVPVEEIAPDESFVNIEKNIIEKSIEFSPEHYQAGIGILSYFGEVLKAKHPESNAKIRIEQHDGFVRLHIHSPNGDKEIIERALKDYTLVVAEKKPVESLFQDELQIMALENKLEIANMEVRQTHRMLEISNKANRSLTEEVTYMRQNLAQQLVHNENSHSLLSNTLEVNKKLTFEAIDQNSKLIDNLIDKSWSSRNVQMALADIKNRLDAVDDIKKSDEEAVKKSLITIRDNSPEIIPELEAVLQNTLYGVSGNIAFLWLQEVIKLVT